MGFRGRFLALRTRLILVFLILMLLPLLAVGIMSYRYYYEVVWDNTTMAAAQAVKNLTRETENAFAEAESFLEIGSYAVAEDYLADREDSYQNAKVILAVMNLYRGRNRFNNDMLDIILLGVNGKGISEREGVFRLRDDFASIPALKQLRYGSFDAALIRFRRYDLSGYWDKADWQREPVMREGESLGLGRYILETTRKTVLGVAIVEINSGKMESICRDQSRGGMVYSIFDAKGNFLFGRPGMESSADWPAIRDRAGGGGSGHFVESLDGEPTFFVHEFSENTGWRIVGRIALDVMMQDARRIRTITLASVFGCILFTMLLYAFVSDRLTKPLKDLQNKMNRAAGGDLAVRFHSRRNDEIGALGESFNFMIGRIEDLMQQTLREQDNLKRAEFRAWQAQINPHFLYNTLDSIVWMSQAARHEEVMTMVVALSRFFRLALNGGREVVTVGEEVDHAANYLIIQRMRYHDIMHYEFSVDPRLRDFRMIKLTLQPLIENAIYHGLKNKRGGGTIWVEGRLDETAGQVVFSVRDDGKGMTPERLAEVREELCRGGRTESGDKGFALRNVHTRIRLTCGADSGLSLESGFDAGTVVTMAFPAVERTE